MTTTTTSTPPEPYVIPAPRYRLPAATRLGVLRLEIADLARSLEYYGNVLGLRVLERTAQRATLGAHGAQGDASPLIELNEVPKARAHPDNARLGLYHFAILLPNRVALGAFVRHLVTRGEAVGASDHLVSEALYLRDPDGLGIEVYADRPRDTWAVRGGQLAMGIDPLDLAGLVRAAGDVQWSGMPAGTTVGHVHLHVGNLAEAEAFFHEVLGFDKVFRMPTALFLSAGGYHHHLGTNTWAGNSPRPQPGDARLLEWTIVLPTAADVVALASHLEAEGRPVSRDADDVVVEDPWGSRFRILSS